MADKRHKILIVEDDEALLEILSDRFKGEGFDVFVAKDGEQGLQMALDKEPDVILLDILMPKLDGLSMLKQLRADERGKKMRVIVTTNVNDSKEVHEALALGARDFLVKSDWILSDLVDSVNRQLEEPFRYVG
ncbi:MAG TPA: response regulator [Candidatus Saccharimonadales bacterium]|nr:response regulator [Candidatus Saccharimonadales bacterium]